MIVKATGKFDVVCPACGEKMGLDAKDFALEVVESHEKPGMGKEQHYAATDEYKCPKCGKGVEVEIEVWEYPIGVMETKRVNVNGKEDPKASFDVEFID